MDVMDIGRIVLDETFNCVGVLDVLVADVKSINLFFTFLRLCQSKCELFNLE